MRTRYDDLGGTSVRPDSALIQVSCHHNKILNTYNGILFTPGGTQTINGVTIRDNQIFQATNSGIHVGFATVYYYGISIANNVITNAPVGIVVYGGGTLAAYMDVSINYNKISDYVNPYPIGIGLNSLVLSASTYLNVIGNELTFLTME